MSIGNRWCTERDYLIKLLPRNARGQPWRLQIIKTIFSVLISPLDTQYVLMLRFLYQVICRELKVEATFFEGKLLNSILGPGAGMERNGSSPRAPSAAGQ